MLSLFSCNEILSQAPCSGNRRFRRALLYHSLQWTLGLNRLIQMKYPKRFPPLHFFELLSHQKFFSLQYRKLSLLLKNQREKNHTILCEEQRRWWIKADVECLQLYKTIRDHACSGFCNLSMSYFIWLNPLWAKHEISAYSIPYFTLSAN